MWTKKPITVSFDFSVSSDANRLYDILCAENYKSGFRTNLVTVSTRPLAELFGRGRSTISRWLKELCDRGHLEKISKHGQSLTFRLLSPIHEQQVKVKVETMPGAVADVTGKDLPVIRDKKRKCLKCGKIRRVASSSGACDVCLAEWVARTARA